MADEKLKVLIIEDDEPVAESIKEAIEAKLPSDCTIEPSFEKGLAIVGSQFDVVILDQMKGPLAQADVAGGPIWKKIHQDAFVPVVVYSAAEIGLDEDFPRDNPVLIYIQKGQDSAGKLAAHLVSHQPIYLALKQLKAEISQVSRDVFLKVAPALIAGGEIATEAKHLARAARRRVAAMMDLKTQSTGEGLLAWEQYIYPPLSDQWLTGDILRLKESPENDPSAYRIMLTPTCDLPRPPAGKSKVDQALVCRCVPFSEFITITQTSQKNEKSFDEKLRTILTNAQVSGLIPLPSFHKRIPSMAAKLKSLELVPLGDIGENCKYKTIASIDSPFREQIGWAFIEIHGRPGIPERDLSSWIKELWEELNRQKAESTKQNVARE
jgi:hypothetical protein